MENRAKIIILSDDTHAITGFRELMRKYFYSSPVNLCFIDVDRFTKMLKLKDAIGNISNEYIFICICRGGISSRQFKNFGTLNIDMSESVSEITKTLEKIIAGNYRHHNRLTWIKLCNVIYNVSVLTSMQKVIFDGIRIGLSPRLLSRTHGLSIKTCYSHTFCIMNKLKVRTLTELYFVANTFYGLP